MDFWAIIEYCKTEERLAWERIKRNHPQLAQDNDLVVHFESTTDLCHQLVERARQLQPERSLEWQETLIGIFIDALNELLACEKELNQVFNINQNV